MIDQFLKMIEEELRLGSEEELRKKELKSRKSRRRKMINIGLIMRLSELWLTKLERRK